MTSTKRTLSLFALTCSLTLVGCSGVASSSTGTAASTSSSSATATRGASGGATAAAATDASALLADNVPAQTSSSETTDESVDALSVTLRDGASSASGGAVTVDGDALTITAAGTYRLKGSLSNGSLTVASPGKGTVRLILDGASITNSQGAAVAIREADEVEIVVADGSTNTVVDGTGYDTSADDAPNAAIFSMADLTITGSGSLKVIGNTNDGIASKDGLVLLGGTIAVTAKDDGIRGKDYLVISGATVSVTTGGDGLKSDNEADDTVGYVYIAGGSTTIDAGDDGIHAEGDLAITDGALTVTSSTEALEGSNVVIAGGTTSVTASDDGLNATQGSTTTQGGGGQGGGPGGGGMGDDGSQLVISGGTLVVDANGDGLDSNGSVTIAGGTTVVYGPTGNGNGALDANGGITVSGGTLLAAGSSGMAEAPDSGSTQGWVQLGFSGVVSKGQTVSIVDGTSVLATFTADKEFTNLVFSSDAITDGSAYDIYFGGALAENPLATFSPGGSIEGATKVGSVAAGQATGGMGQR